MVQQIQFVYLAQSEYDALTKQGNILYFTSDTHRIYRGTDLYATTSFDTVSAQTATFGDLTVTGNVSMSLSQVQFGSIMASDISVNGSSVALDGHTHVMSDIEGLSELGSSISAMAIAMSGISESNISKTSATFQDLVVTGDVTFSVDQLDFQSLTASSITVDGKSVSLEGHGHSASDISNFSDSVVSAGTSVFASASHTHDGLQGLTSNSISKDSAWFDSISASTATFDNLVVTGDVSLSLSQVQFGSIMASEITVNGSSVSLEGHLHSIPDISGLSSILSGMTESSIWKNQVSASAATFDQVTADIGNFRLISVSGSANFAVNNVSASAVSVNGTPVSLEGHAHTMSQITGLESYVQAFAAYESRIAALESMVSGLEQALHSINTGA